MLCTRHCSRLCLIIFSDIYICVCVRKKFFFYSHFHFPSVAFCVTLPGIFFSVTVFLNISSIPFLISLFQFRFYLCKSWGIEVCLLDLLHWGFWWAWGSAHFTIIRQMWFLSAHGNTFLVCFFSLYFSIAVPLYRVCTGTFSWLLLLNEVFSLFGPWG